MTDNEASRNCYTNYKLNKRKLKIYNIPGGHTHNITTADFIFIFLSLRNFFILGILTCLEWL